MKNYQILSDLIYSHVLAGILDFWTLDFNKKLFIVEFLKNKDNNTVAITCFSSGKNKRSRYIEKVQSARNYCTCEKYGDNSSNPCHQQKNWVNPMFITFKTLLFNMRSQPSLGSWEKSFYIIKSFFVTVLFK